MKPTFTDKEKAIIKFFLSNGNKKAYQKQISQGAGVSEQYLGPGEEGRLFALVKSKILVYEHGKVRKRLSIFFSLNETFTTFKLIAFEFLKDEDSSFIFTSSSYAQQFLRNTPDYLSNYRRLPGLQSFFSRGLRLSPTFAKYLIFENDAVVALMSSLLLSHCNIEDATITMEKGKIETNSFYGFTAGLYTSLIVDAMKYPQLKKPVTSLLGGGPIMGPDGKYEKDKEGKLIIASAPRMLYEDFGFLKPHFSIHGKASLHDGRLEVGFSLPPKVVAEQLREWQKEQSKH